MPARFAEAILMRRLIHGTRIAELATGDAVSATTAPRTMGSTCSPIMLLTRDESFLSPGRRRT
jgi:hypothetical protein